MERLNNFVIRGSSNGLFRNQEFISATDVGCPRKTILRHLDVQQNVGLKTEQIFKIGALFEDWYGKQHPEYEREKEIKADGFSGHSDFYKEGEIVETKSCTSKNTYREVFKQNKCKPQYVIQLACYMTMLEVSRGLLVFGSYVHIADYSKLQKMNPNDILPLFDNATPELKTFVVTIDEQGFVLVDGENFHNINVTEILAFQDNLHELVKHRILPPRVEALEPNSWSGVCKYCPLATLCDSNVNDLEEFVETAAEIYDQQI